MYRGKLASTELFTILGGSLGIIKKPLASRLGGVLTRHSIMTEKETTFMNSILKTTTSSTNGVIFAELAALIAAGTVHRVCITTCNMCCWEELNHHSREWSEVDSLNCILTSSRMEDWFQLVGKMTQNFAVSHYRMALLFSAGLLYEINKLSGTTLSKSESKMRRH
ncbi:unnamed protein product [Camellia sinensis]